MTTKARYVLPLALLGGMVGTVPALAEFLAVMTYESKPGEAERREGLAVMELDMASPNFGKIDKDIPLPPDLVAHHIFHNPENTKAYITALGRPELRILDIETMDLKVVEVPSCEVGENVSFSERTESWYLTCMGSSVMVVGDRATDEPLRTVALDAPYPHGIAVHDGIGRILLTSTVRASDLQDPGYVILALDLETEETIAQHKIGNGGSAPVEVVFIPGSDPPQAYTTAMYEGTLWLGSWDPQEKSFSWQQTIDFKGMGQGLPLEIYYNGAGNRAYISTANPGHLNIYDIADPAKPKLLHSVATAGGAHHMVFTPDYSHAFVQNSFINLPDMHDGSISVVDLEKGEVVRSINTLKDRGLTPNNISLLRGGHAH
jgi:DNA-binding beta-propeller fold protein YncE